MIALTTKQLKEIKNLTAINAHTEAYITACKLLGLDDLVEKLIKIQHRQDRIGYLDCCDAHERYSLYQSMISCAKRLMIEAEFKQFYQCF